LRGKLSKDSELFTLQNLKEPPCLKKKNLITKNTMGQEVLKDLGVTKLVGV
jgi:hypothetical protein